MKKDKRETMQNDGQDVERKQTSQPGAPQRSNRQTGGSNRNERDDSGKGPEKNTTKKGANSI